MILLKGSMTKPLKKSKFFFIDNTVTKSYIWSTVVWDFFLWRLCNKWQWSSIKAERGYKCTMLIWSLSIDYLGWLSIDYLGCSTSYKLIFLLVPIVKHFFSFSNHGLILVFWQLFCWVTVHSGFKISVF